jgi:hypothetical protein
MAETKRRPRESIARWCGFLAGPLPRPYPPRPRPRSYARPAGSGVRVGCQLLGRFLDGLSLTSSLDGA